jgi:hypothetical protein
MGSNRKPQLGRLEVRVVAGLHVAGVRASCSPRASFTGSCRDQIGVIVSTIVTILILLYVIAAIASWVGSLAISPGHAGSAAVRLALVDRWSTGLRHG